MAVTSRTRFAKLSWASWSHGRTTVMLDFLILIRGSTFRTLTASEFNSCTLRREELSREYFVKLQSKFDTREIALLLPLTKVHGLYGICMPKEMV